MEIATLPTLKTITWETNYNNKMVCNAFIHLDLAPVKFPVRSVVDKMVFEIRTDDQTHPPIETKLYDWMLFPLRSVTDCLAFASHGITAKEFEEFIKTKYGEETLKQRGIALYYYLKQNK